MLKNMSFRFSSNGEKQTKKTKKKRCLSPYYFIVLSGKASPRMLHCISTRTYFIIAPAYSRARYIEDIQIFLLNMAFISPSEVENINIS